MEIVYNERVSQLENVVSYGTLAILNTLMSHANDHPHDKHNVFLINGATIVRNCYDHALKDTEILKKVATDAEYLRQYFEIYASGPAMCIFYFNPTIRYMIPSVSRRKETPVRMAIDRLTDAVAKSEKLPKNSMTEIGKSGSMTYYGLLSFKDFSYRIIISELRKLMINTHFLPALVTHCPIDFFLMEKFAGIKLIESHTGKIILPIGFGKKVFGVDGVPFNRTTYKLFGDKDFIKPVIRNHNVVLKKLSVRNLKLRTESEIKRIILSEFVNDPMMSDFLNWKL
jgi:hypothetical protein